MNETHSSLQIDTLLALLLVASATAISVKWVRMPYSVALVIAGLIIGVSGIMPPVAMTPDLILVIFLPALLFEASWNMDIRALRRDWLAIGTLATVGVVVCMSAVAAILHFVGGLDIPTSMLFGAMVSATDPVSVIALFRKMGIDKRLTMLLEGESVFNDGTAVVLFKLVLAAVLSGGSASIAAVSGGFVFAVVGGSLIGALIGYFASRITSAFEDHLLEITLTTVAAYGSYLVADHLHVSPVMAVVGAGIVVGNYGSRTGMSAVTRLAVNSFWEYAAFLVNSLLFLLIGLQVKLELLIKYGNLIGFGVLAVVVSRLLVVYGLCPFVSTRGLPIASSWRHLLFWGGLRGALCLALALSLPLDFPLREAVINMTFGVVLFTLLVPGLTMEPLVELLSMLPADRDLLKYQELRSQVLADKVGQDTLELLYEAGSISGKAYESLKQEIAHHLEAAEAQLLSAKVACAPVEELDSKQARIRLLEARKDFLSRFSRQGMLAEESLQKFKVLIDLELEQLAEPGQAGKI